MNAHQQAAFDQWFAVENERQDLESFSSQSNMQIAYAQALASQSETLRALVEALKEAREKMDLQHTALKQEYAGGNHIGAIRQRIDAALSLAAELGVE